MKKQGLCCTPPYANFRRSCRANTASCATLSLTMASLQTVPTALIVVSGIASGESARRKQLKNKLSIR